jgi:hypothetical protein
MDALLRQKSNSMSVSLRKDPDFDSPLSELVDLTGVTEPAIDAGGFQSLARIDPFSHSAKRAFVARAGVTYGVTRMFQIMRDNR